MYGACGGRVIDNQAMVGEGLDNHLKHTWTIILQWYFNRDYHHYAFFLKTILNTKLVWNA